MASIKRQLISVCDAYENGNIEPRLAFSTMMRMMDDFPHLVATACNRRDVWNNRVYSTHYGAMEALMEMFPAAEIFSMSGFPYVNSAAVTDHFTFAVLVKTKKEMVDAIRKLGPGRQLSYHQDGDISYLAFESTAAVKINIRLYSNNRTTQCMQRAYDNTQYNLKQEIQDKITCVQSILFNVEKQYLTFIRMLMTLSVEDCA